MFASILNADALGVLFLLLGLELVLGVDNVLVIAILVSRLPAHMRKKARIMGLTLALVGRIMALAVVLWLAQLTQPVVFHFSVRDLILLAGGLFLLYKAVTEIHHVVELKEEERAGQHHISASFRNAIIQIVLLDMVFSVDSVITAVGLTRDFWIIVSAVTLSFLCILAYAGPIGEFILRNPSLKILALSFLVTIGVTIFMEGMGAHVPKTYIYLPMGFALGVEMLQMRYFHNQQKKKAQGLSNGGKH